MVMAGMHTRSLESLLWIVRLGGIGAAARHLNLTQPAVTRRIQELEQELGARLFRRESRGVALTPVGRSCVAIAERIVSEVATLRQAASGDAAFSGTIRLGVSEVVALSWLRRLLSRIEDGYPNIHLELDIDLSARLLRKLDARQADVVLLPGPVSLPHAIKVHLGSSRLRWMSRPGFLTPRRHFLPAHIAAVPIIHLSRDANASAVMEAWFNNSGVKPRRVDYCNSLSVVASLVRDGFGVSLLPKELFIGSIENGELTVLPERPLVAKVDYWAVYLPAPELPVLPRIAALASEESWFLRPSDHLWRKLRR